MRQIIEQCWSFSRVNLGLSEQEFWSLTPREFRLLADEWCVAQKREAMNTAALMALIANCHKSADTTAFKPEDFLAEAADKKRPIDLGEAFSILKHLKQN